MLASCGRCGSMIVVVLCLCLSWGCSSDDSDWEKARVQNSIESYQGYLAKHSGGRFTAEAKENIEGLKIVSQRPEKYRYLKKIRMVVNQSYGDAKRVALPYRLVAQDWFRHARVEVVSDDAKEYDATLTIQVTGKALSSSYQEVKESASDPKTLYTGVDLQGSITFETAKGDKLQEKFSDVDPPMSMFGQPKEGKRDYLTPDEAPFKSTFQASLNLFGGVEEIVLDKVDKKDSFMSKLGLMVQKVFGTPAVVSALKDKNQEVRKRAAFVLGGVKDAPSVDALLFALNDEDPLVAALAVHSLGMLKDTRAVQPLIVVTKKDATPVYEYHAALNSLKKITGKKFDSPAKWQEWWDGERSKK